MKIIKFIKKNYKKIIIQVVSIVSALVLFCIPAYAVTLEEIHVATGLYATDSSIRDGDFSGINWGEVIQTFSFSRFVDFGVGNRPQMYGITYDRLDNSWDLQNRYLVTTFQITRDSFSLQNGKTYKITIPLFFEMATDKRIKTDYIKFSFWDIYDNSHNPYLNFYDNSLIEWSPSYDYLLQGYVSKHTFYLRNDTGRDISPTHLRFALRFNSTLKLWEGNSWGFYDKIIVEESDFTWKPGGVSFVNGMKSVSMFFNYITNNFSTFSEILKFSIGIGLVGLIIGFAPQIFGLFKSQKSSNSKTKKGGA